MKTCLRLALAVFMLAGLVTVPASVSGDSFTPVQQLGGGSFDFQCAQFCMVALCAEACGVYTDENGQRACGCYSLGGGVL